MSDFTGNFTVSDVNGLHSSKAITFHIVPPPLISLLHFDTDFSDVTGRVWTPSGSPSISAAQSKFGGASLYLPHDESHLSTPSTGDIRLQTDATVEGWVYPLTADVNNVVISNRGPNGYWFGMNAGVLEIITWNSSGTVKIIFTGSAVALNAWNYFALVFDYTGGQVRLYQGSPTATLAGSAPLAAGYLDNGGPVNIGRDPTHIGRSWNGYIDECRITAAVLYASSYPAPTIAF